MISESTTVSTIDSADVEQNQPVAIWDEKGASHANDESKLKVEPQDTTIPPPASVESCYQPTPSPECLASLAATIPDVEHPEAPGLSYGSLFTEISRSRLAACAEDADVCTGKDLTRLVLASNACIEYPENIYAELELYERQLDEDTVLPHEIYHQVREGARKNYLTKIWVREQCNRIGADWATLRSGNADAIMRAAELGDQTAARIVVSEVVRSKAEVDWDRLEAIADTIMLEDPKHGFIQKALIAHFKRPSDWFIRPLEERQERFFAIASYVRAIELLDQDFQVPIEIEVIKRQSDLELSEDRKSMIESEAVTLIASLSRSLRAKRRGSR